MFNEKRYRLRKDEKVVGYMRKINENMVFYSKDAFWWTGRKVHYNTIDEWTGLRDKNRIHIYEWDIVKCKIDPDADYTDGVVLWEEHSKRFGIKAIKEDVFIPLDMDGIQMFNEREIKVYSYLFINPDLKNRLGVQE